MNNNLKGFTLIELLVVIAIIAILAVVGVTVFRGISGNARDSRRKADIDAIAQAYEVKHNSTGSYQPLANADFAGGVIPKKPEGGDYYGEITANASGFQVCAALEANSLRSCNVPDTNCYCKQSTQGAYVWQQNSTTTNLITNSNFEVDTSGWTNNIGGSRSNDTAVFGSYSLKQVDSGMNYMTLTTLTTGIPYTLSYYVKRTNVIGGAGSGMQVNSSGSWTVKWVNGTNNWQRETITFTSAGTTAVVYAQNNGSTGTTYYDGIQLEEGSEATPY